MGKDEVQDAVLDAARVAFRSRGYVRTTMKGVAAAAGVAPEVMSNYYNSKDQLFQAVIRLPLDPLGSIPTLVAPGIDGLGERLTRVTLETFQDPEAREDLLALARAGVSSGKAVAGLRATIEEGIVDRLAGVIGVPDARLRANLITSYLIGIAIGRYVVRMEPLASLSDDEVVKLVSPMVQAWLTPTKPLSGRNKEGTESPGPKVESDTDEGHRNSSSHSSGRKSSTSRSTSASRSSSSSRSSAKSSKPASGSKGATKSNRSNSSRPARSTRSSSYRSGKPRT